MIAVDVWPVGLRPVVGSAEWLSPEEVSHAERRRPGPPRDRFVARRLALRAVLASYLRLHPADVVFDRRCRLCGAASHGKPRVLSSSGIEFSSASSADLALVAVAPSGQEIGVDLEVRSTVHEHTQIARRFFTAAEARILERARWSGDPSSFLRIWTRKEAVLKAVGVGLATDLDLVDVSTSEVNVGCFPSPSVHSRFRVVDLEPNLGYVAALASPGSSPIVRYRDHSSEWKEQTWRR